MNRDYPTYSTAQLFAALESINDKLQPVRAKQIYHILCQRVGVRGIEQRYEEKFGLGAIMSFIWHVLVYPFANEPVEPAIMQAKIARIKGYASP